MTASPMTPGQLVRSVIIGRRKIRGEKADARTWEEIRPEDRADFEDAAEHAIRADTPLYAELGQQLAEAEMTAATCRIRLAEAQAEKTELVHAVMAATGQAGRFEGERNAVCRILRQVLAEFGDPDERLMRHASVTAATITRWCKEASE